MLISGKQKLNIIFFLISGVVQKFYDMESLEGLSDHQVMLKFTIKIYTINYY